ncbi:MAG: malonate decarboxylase holo-[acyl-carrier-protein] synthase [Solidesulfovibrio sp. DCME]|uniref:malonate decarboxylase holo-[acyl-carrier-protein] synthase n=1 Tax=Solidesulfovibrio sp. DCME TaxID=3447380 RepID=UPI003D14489B
MTPATPPTRHAIVRPGPGALDDGALRLEGAGGPVADYVRAWVGAGRPLIVRRPCLDAAGRLCCGLPTPPADGKLRLSLTLPLAAVAGLEPPPLLADCLGAAPAAWREGLGALVAEARAGGFAPFRAVGSLAWQHLTGLAYLGPDSDVDLVVPIDRREALTRLAGLLRAHQTRHCPRLDAEVRLPGGASFSWREYAGLPRKLLVKTDTEVFLADHQALVGALPA